MRIIAFFSCLNALQNNQCINLKYDVNLNLMLILMRPTYEITQYYFD